ncbi:MAG TPA: nucleoside diphosphate kinase regulator [Thalassobaculum sp.]
MRENPQPRNQRRKPDITISEIDYDRLSDLADASRSRAPEVAEELLLELDRASVVAAGGVPPSVVQMGSTVEFKADQGQPTRVVLVFPGEADVAAGKISIMTPIGAALIGLSAGQTISWTARDGRQHELTVLAVEEPERADA